jgi:hypothetical protein
MTERYFNIDNYTVPNNYEKIQPTRGYDYVTNDGCWILAKTPFTEIDNTFMLYIRLDRNGTLVTRDPQLVADWSF